MIVDTSDVFRFTVFLMQLHCMISSGEGWILSYFDDIWPGHERSREQEVLRNLSRFLRPTWCHTRLLASSVSRCACSAQCRVNVVYMMDGCCYCTMKSTTA